MKFLLALALLCVPCWAATYNSDGSRADVQAKVDLASSGDTVTIPAGSFTWADTVTITGKAIHLQGAGAGRIVARSLSSVAIGTGAKVFTLESTSVASIEALKSAITGGVTLLLEETCATANYMQGTVTSLVGSTLTMNITSTGGSGTPVIWIISTLPTSTIVHGAAYNVPLISGFEDATGSVEVSGLRFVQGSEVGTWGIAWGSVTGGKPWLIHDCFVRVTVEGADIRVFDTSSIHGVVWNCSFSSTVFAMAPENIVQKDPSNLDPLASGSWDRVSTMGTADTTGGFNFYVEDCDFHGFNNAGEADDNARQVVRYCLFNNSGWVTHGNDTSAIGMRHLEMYDNDFVFNDLGMGTFNLQSWLYVRGGTLVITDNVMPDINSMEYGDKPEIRISIQDLQRTVPGWGEFPVKNITGISVANPTTVTTSAAHGLTTGDYTRIGTANSTPTITGYRQITSTGASTFTVPVNVTVSGNTGTSNRVDYHFPRQPGFGYVTGLGVDGLGNTTEGGIYVGDSEPMYQWDNTGGGAYATPSIQDYSVPTLDQDHNEDYLIIGRDWLNATKPGYAKSTYPNPFRTGGSSGNTLTVAGTTTVTGVLTLPP